GRVARDPALARLARRELLPALPHPLQPAVGALRREAHAAPQTTGRACRPRRVGRDPPGRAGANAAAAMAALPPAAPRDGERYPRCDRYAAPRLHRVAPAAGVAGHQGRDTHLGLLLLEPRRQLRVDGGL